MISSCF